MNLNHDFYEPEQLVQLSQKIKTEISGIEERLNNGFLNQIDDGNMMADVCDRATLEEERAAAQMQRHRETHRLIQFRAALSRLQNRRLDFGYCTSCGAEIDFERMMTCPTTTFCMECQRMTEIRERIGIGHPHDH